MKPEEQRIAIAKACGWTRVEWYEDNAGPPILHGFPPTQVGYSSTGDWQALTKEHTSHVPDYLADLNAMHEAWMSLDRKQRIDCSMHIRRIVVYPGMSAFNEDIVALCENATAPQRAEAFLKTLGLWTE